MPSFAMENIIVEIKQMKPTVSIAIINNDLCNSKSSINCEQDILHSTRLANHGIQFEYTRPVQICIKR